MEPAGKVELHLHMDCAASYAAVAALAPGTSFADYRRDFVGAPKAASLVDLLRRPRRIVALMQDTRGLRVITEDLFDQLARDGVVYAELRFAPFQHTEAGMRVEEVVAEVERSAAAAAAATGIDARLILCTVRHFSAEQSMRTAELVRQFQGSLVAALDIAGDEAGYPLDAHEPAFRYAIEHGRPRQRLGDAAAAGALAHRSWRPQHRGPGAGRPPEGAGHPPGGLPLVQRPDRCGGQLPGPPGRPAVPRRRPAGHLHRRAHDGRHQPDRRVRASARQLRLGR